MPNTSDNVKTVSNGKHQLILAVIGFMEWHSWTYIVHDLAVKNGDSPTLIQWMDVACKVAVFLAAISFLRAIYFYRKSRRKS